MTTKRRIAIFTVSAVITSGLLFSMFWEGDWLPGNQVKMALLDNPTQGLQLTDKSRCTLECHGLNLADAKHMIRNGEVNFSKSSPRQKPCKVYLIEFEDATLDKSYELTVNWCKEEIENVKNEEGVEGTKINEPVYLVDFKEVGKDCDCPKN